jgi:RNA polymerase sigma factor (sigma-70 family)
VTPRLMHEPLRVAGSSLMRCQSDERLVELVRSGSAPAFEAVVERYGGPLTRYCRRLLSPARAEDAVQQTFVNAYTAICRDDSRIDLRPWLYRIARNAALNALTRDREWSSPRVAELPEAGESVHDEVQRRLDLRSAFHAVQGLPARQRDAIVLRELEGRSYDQIASELEVSDGAVRQLLSRARETLRGAASALTPIGLLVRLGPGSQPALSRAAEIAANPALPAGVYRGVAAAVAGAVLVGGLAQGGRQPAGLREPAPAVRAAVVPTAAGGPVPVPAGRGLTALGPGLALMPRSPSPVAAPAEMPGQTPARGGTPRPNGAARTDGALTAPTAPEPVLRGTRDLAAAPSGTGVVIGLGAPSAISAPGVAPPGAGAGAEAGGQTLRVLKPLAGAARGGAQAPAPAAGKLAGGGR